MDLQIDDTKVKKAFKSLFAHEMKKNNSKVESVWLMINTWKPVDLVKSAPKRIPLKHALQTAGTRRCIFTRDSQKKYKQILVSKKIKGIHKVIGISKLRKDYSSIAKRRELMSEYDVFLVDKRIIHLLPDVLGKEVYKKRKEPMPFDFSAADLQKEVLAAARSTYMHFNYGTCYALKIATTALNHFQAFENFINALPDIVKGVYGGSENIRSLQVKTAESASLPLYDANQDGQQQETAKNDEEEEEEEEDWS
ncbi:hypothetical protein VTP01DRAFT_7323 [Rhizomucor pusillus]|uniref:uncharacterized protein n=1 Tax=Rhizomucor pusillus TaxID=4840 RepID=UPI0037428CE9